MSFSDLKSNPYKLINIILAGIILLIIIYSIIYSPEKSNHLIPSNSKTILNEESRSTGLSHSFSSIVRFNFEEAREYNEYGLQVFTFFVIQLFMRIFFLFSYDSILEFGHKRIILLDSIISISLFIFFFMPFFEELTYF